jgi:hypothetical protein
MFLSLLCVGFAIVLPLASNLANVSNDLHFPFFLAGYVLLAALAMLSVLGWTKIPSIEVLIPLSLHRLHSAILALFLPITFGITFFLELFLFPSNLENYMFLALWFEVAYLLSFSFLIRIYGSIFRMDYRDTSTISPIVAKHMARESLRLLTGNEQEQLEGFMTLRRAYDMTARWIRSGGYECREIEQTLQRLDLAYMLDQVLPINTLRLLGKALEALPKWPSVVTRLRRFTKTRLMWTSAFERGAGSVDDKGQRSTLTTALAVLLAIGTLIGPFLSAYPDFFRNTIQAASPLLVTIISFLLVWLLFIPCQSYWKRTYKTVWDFH